MDALTPATLMPQAQSTSLDEMRARTLAARSTSDIDKTSKDFERMALGQMLAQMETDTDMSESMFGGGAGERAFKPFLTEEYARGFSDRGGIGIAEAVKREMLHIQEAARARGAS
jgi:flagellar protein FlgJ